MEKLNKKEIQEIIEKLKPYWKEYIKIFYEYVKKTNILEKKMNCKLKPKTKLEFFYVDGECVGIGAENFSDRKFFPLIDSSKLEEKQNNKHSA